MYIKFEKENTMIRIKKVLVGGIIILNAFCTSVALSKDQESNLSGLESKLEEAAKNLVEKNLKEMKHSLDSADLEHGPSAGFRISPDLMIGGAKDAVRQKIAKIRKNIKAIVITAALNIEKGYDFSIKISEDELVMSENQKKKMKKFADSIRNTNVSVKSIVMTVNILLGINDSLIDAAEKEENTEKKRIMYATQAVLVYELSSILKDMLDSLGTRDIDELRNIFNEEMNEISKIENRIKQLVDSEDDPQYKKLLEKRADDWLSALNITRNNWNGVLSILNDQEDWIESWKKSKKRFDTISKEASIQLDVIERIHIVSKVMETIESLREVMAKTDIPLLHLDKETALALIGMQPFGGDIEGESKKLEAQ